MGRRLLALGVSVIVEWGTWGADERETLRRDAAAAGAETELYLLDPPIEVLWQRIQARNLEDPPAIYEDLERWSASFQRPEPDELARYARVHRVD